MAFPCIRYFLNHILNIPFMLQHTLHMVKKYFFEKQIFTTEITTLWKKNRGINRFFWEKISTFTETNCS